MAGPAGPFPGGRTADHPVDPQFPSRWSPRAFTAEPIPDEVLFSLFEAARWAPSAFNGQPWRFVYAHHGTEDFDRLLDVLIPYNQAWAKNASVLMFAISDRFRRAEGREPAPVSNAWLRTGTGSRPSARRKRSETMYISTEAFFTQAWLYGISTSNSRSHSAEPRWA